jgi:hypothetical protein
MQRANGRLPMLSIQNKNDSGIGSKFRSKIGDQNSKFYYLSK